ncbi:MAG: Spy/CpxP family protein refolding chaperone [Bacillota bacterium]
MRKTVLIVAAVTLAVFSVAGVALASPWGEEIRAARLGGLAGLRRAIREGTAFTPPAQALDLTDEQVEQVQEILSRAAAESQAIETKIMEKKAELRLLLWQKNPDQADLEAIYEEIAELRQQLAEVASEARDEVRALLTPEQQEKLPEVPGIGARLCHRGGRPGLGMGMGGWF